MTDNVTTTVPLPVPAPEYYLTTDLALDSFLSARGMRQVGLERDGNNTVTFKYADREACVKLASEWALGQTPEKLFWDAMRRERSKIFRGW